MPFPYWRQPETDCALATLPAQRICIVKPSALGDVIQALPILSALRGRYPKAHIAWVINRAYAELLDQHPDLDERIVFDRVRGLPISRGARKAITEIRTRLSTGRFDLTIDLQGLLRSGLMTRWTRAARRIGMSDCREGSRFCYTDLVAIPAEAVSAVDRYWAIAQALGAASAPKRFHIALSPSDQAWAEERCGDSHRFRVVINPGARWATKRWPPEHFASIARRLMSDFDVSVILVGGPEDIPAANCIAGQLSGRVTNIAGQTTLKQLAAVLALANLVLTNDSGPMHLAAALGTPVAALFTCTSPDRARPYGDQHLLIQTGVWCRASYVKRCGRMECMAELTPDRVWPALRLRMESLLRSRAA